MVHIFPLILLPVSNLFLRHITLEVFMRFPSIPTFIRTLYAFSNTTARAPPKVFNSLARPTALRASMPIPFIGALFSTAESRKMSYPVHKEEDVWKEELAKHNKPGKGKSKSIKVLHQHHHAAIF